MQITTLHLKIHFYGGLAVNTKILVNLQRFSKISFEFVIFIFNQFKKM